MLIFHQKINSTVVEVALRQQIENGFIFQVKDTCLITTSVISYRFYQLQAE